MEEDEATLAEQAAWRQIIGAKIICSECKNHNSDNFRFSINKIGPKTHVHIRCLRCDHQGDYNPTDEEVYQYEYIARANIDKEILKQHGENPPISNVEVDSVFRREKWKDNVPPEVLDEWESKCEENYALKA